MTKESTKSSTITETQESLGAELILYNDEFNTFDFVIDSLVIICKHTPLQAEQSALLVHHKGKTGIKKGNYETLLPMYHALTDRNLTVELKI